MNHWIVTQHPRRDDEDVTWDIYFRAPRKQMPALGDRVAFYETETTFRDWKRKGRKAIIQIGRVSGVLGPMTGIEPWVYRLPCEKVRSCYLPLDRARVIAGSRFYRQNLTPISAANFAKIEREAVQNPTPRN